MPCLGYVSGPGALSASPSGVNHKGTLHARKQRTAGALMKKLGEEVRLVPVLELT